jgi:hypothetical protein
MKTLNSEPRIEINWTPGAWVGDTDHPLGHMTIERTVWCGLCVKWSQQCEHSQRRMNRVVRSAGWRKTRERGWLCPACMALNRQRGKPVSPTA